MIIKKHITPDRRKILAVCDDDLLGKRFEEDGCQLDLTVGFYRGEPATEEQFEKELKGVYILNIVGKMSIDLCLKRNLILKEHIKRIKNIPYAQCMII